MPKTKTKTADKTLNKAAWIRSQPADLGAADVVKRAKAAGFKLSLAQVYVTRSLAKKRASSKGGAKVAKPAPAAQAAAKIVAAKPSAAKKPAPVAKKAAPAPKAATAKAHVAKPAAGSKDPRTEFVRLVMKIGTDEARRLLERVEDVQVGALGR